MKNPWQTHLSRETYQNAWIRVREDQITDPGGNPGIYGVVEFKNRAVGIVPIDDEGYTYLVGQYRYCHQSFEWEIPEGGCPEGEELIDTARRELKEETGIRADHFEMFLGDLQLSNSTTNEVAYLFTARGLHFKKAAPETTEQIEVKRVHLDDAIEMARNGTIRDAMSVIALLWLGSQP